MDIISATGDFYELHNVFWYDFFNSAAYTNLETNFAANIVDAIKPVAASIDLEREDFVNAVENIDQVQSFRSSQSSALSEVLDQPINTNEISARLLQPTSETLDTVGDVVARLSSLANALVSGQGGDIDKDGVFDGEDNCIASANTDQSDTDGDGLGDVCDMNLADSDHDGRPDSEDNFPFVAETNLCNGNDVVITPVHYLSGAVFNCRAQNTIQTQGIVEVKMGVDVLYMATSLSFTTGFRVRSGGVFRGVAATQIAP